MELATIRKARERLGPYLEPTPLVRTVSPSLAQDLKPRELHLKLETQQPTGSFKIRPALNGLLSQLNDARARGVLASSSGNFAQAVAYSASLLNCQATIVMTSDTSPTKIERTRNLGAEMILCPPTFKDRWETTYRIQKETGRVLLHPYDSAETIAGNGTLALELNEQLPPGKITVIVPVSGGGLLAGVAAAIKQLRPDATVIGAQPAGNASMKKSLQNRTPTKVPAFRSIADALVAIEPGQYAFSILRKYVDDIILVSEEQIQRALHVLFLEQRLVVEPAGAVSVAAALISEQTNPTYAGDPMICIVSGGNISLESIASSVLNFRN